ncbi:MAG: SDR family oxidoreductase [Phycisphaerae bacterium]|nr:SDR family oxidoreductase [Phycisphaerae bacterium]
MATGDAFARGKSVLVTGASSGIGYELTRCFARDGYDLVLLARQVEALEKTAEEMHREFEVETRVLARDLSDPAASRQVHDRLAGDGVEIDVLVNNAGLGTYGRFAQTDLEKELAMIQVNVTALTGLSKLFLRDMLGRGRGRILNVGSMAGFQPGPLMAVYYATKAYVLSLTQALANEIAGSGVTVSVLCPGPTETDFTRRAGTGKVAMFQSSRAMDARTVARIGYRGLMRGKTIIIPKGGDRLLIQLERLLPRKTVTEIVRRFQESRS